MSKLKLFAKYVMGIGCLFALFTGCSEEKNYYIIEPPCCDCGDSISSDSSKTKVNFTAGIESIVATRSISALQVGRYAAVYVFEDGEDTGFPINFGIYRSKSIGYLTPIENEMYLLNGEYDFFAFSTNDTVSNLPGTYSQYVPLSNDIDYIWAQAPKQDIYNTIVNVPLTFVHCCSQIVLNVVAGNNIYLGTVQSVQVTPSQTGNKLDMFTGVIPPATTISEQHIDMHINKTMAQVIMVPLQSSDSLKVTIVAEVDAVNNYSTFYCKIPVYPGGFKAGNSYAYEVILDPDQIGRASCRERVSSPV